MKKVTFLIIILILFLAGIPVLANEDTSIDFVKASGLLEKNNSELKELIRQEKNAHSEYQQAENSAKVTDIDGITYNFNGESFFFPYDDKVKIMMRQQKELSPEQAKFSWDTAKNNLEINKRNLQYTIRDTYQELLRAWLDSDEKNKIYNFEVEKNQLAKKKLDKGIVSKLDLDEAEYNLLAAKTTSENAKRVFENASRSFNLSVGNKLDREYSDIISEELVGSIGLYSVNDCIKQAMQNREDILSLRAQIKLKEHELEIIKRNDAISVYKDLKEEYDDGIFEIERLKAELEKAEYSINYEIGTAYSELVKGYAELKNTLNSLMTKRNDFGKLQTKLKKNLISRLDYTNSELELLSIENKYKLDVFSYNTRVIKFKNAIGLGPAY